MRYSHRPGTWFSEDIQHVATIPKTTHTHTHIRHICTTSRCKGIWKANAISQTSICRSSVNLTNYSTPSTEANRIECIPQHHSLPVDESSLSNQAAAAYIEDLYYIWPKPLWPLQLLRPQHLAGSLLVHQCIYGFATHFAGITMHFPFHIELRSYIRWFISWTQRLTHAYMHTLTGI